MTEPKSERVNGPIPNGGSYAIIYWQDVDGMPVTKEEALRAEVFEYAADGRAIAVTILDLLGGED